MNYLKCPARPTGARQPQEGLDLGLALLQLLLQVVIIIIIIITRPWPASYYI